MTKFFKRYALLMLSNFLIVAMLVAVYLILVANGVIPNTQSYLGLAIFSLLIGFGGAFISLAISRVIAKSFGGVQVIDPNASLDPYNRWLVDTVHELASKAGMKTMPEVGVYDSEEVNAFATGPSEKYSLVAFSSGLLRKMDQDAVEGVAAHEVAHIVNGDMVTMTLLQGLINTFVIFLARIAANIASSFLKSDSFWVYFLLVMVFQTVFAFLGSLVVFAFSRHREYKADALGAQLSSKSKMLWGLQSLQKTLPFAVAEPQPAMATMKISNKASWIKFFSTHPPLEERIAALQKLP